jgi:DNA-binding transcriptional LysR family regulator
MNIKHLEHLIGLEETGSFSRAAEKLFITQSALSRSIQNLEEELGGKLLDRIGKKNVLTPLGEEVVRRARQILQSTAALKISAKLFQQASGGKIRIGLGSGPGALLMTPLLCHMATHLPHIQTTITRGPTELQLMQLRARQLDALVVDARRVPPASDLTIEFLSELRAGFVCRRDHPLTKLRSVGLIDMLAYPIASTPLADEVARLIIQRYGPQADPKSMTTLECEDVASLIDTTQRTDAVFLGIIAAARAGIQSGKLTEIKIKPALNAFAQFAYITLTGSTEAPVMKFFRSFVAEHLVD